MNNPYRRGPKRNPTYYLVALEYILWPGKRHHGLVKQLAYANDMTPKHLSSVIWRIRSACK